MIYQMPLEEVEEVFRGTTPTGRFLDFDEFCGMLDDLVGDKIVKKRVRSMLSINCAHNWMDDETVASLTVAFGQFDRKPGTGWDLDEFRQPCATWATI